MYRRCFPRLLLRRFPVRFSIRRSLALRSIAVAGVATFAMSEVEGKGADMGMSLPKSSQMGSGISLQPSGYGNMGGMLLIVFIHGFKGSAETTFEDFPSRLAHILGATYPGLKVESLIYPTYDTRGNLSTAVDNFTEWLTSEVVMRESKPDLDEQGNMIPSSTSGRGGGAGSVRIVLAAHSMGGLVAVDSAVSVAASSSSADDHKLWPRICGVVAYDTPYYGVHPNVFKNSLTKYGGHLKTAWDVGQHLAPIGGVLAARWGFGRADSSSKEQPSEEKVQQPQGSRSTRTAPATLSSSESPAWGKWFSSLSVKDSSTAEAAEQKSTSSSSRPQAERSGSGSLWTSALMAGGALALAGGAAAGYANRDKITGSYTWVSDHLLYVSNLFDSGSQRQRLNSLVELPQVLFHCYFTRIPARPARGEHERTFIILPARTDHAAPSFTPCDCVTSPDEVSAHTGMFSEKENSSYRDLVLKSTEIIGLVLENEILHGEQIRSQAQTEEAPTEEAGLREGDQEVEQGKREATAEQARAQQQWAKEENPSSTGSVRLLSATDKATQKTDSEPIAHRTRRRVGSYRGRDPDYTAPVDDDGLEPITSKGEHLRWSSTPQGDAEYLDDR